jgi:hypothetical protein
MLDRDHMDTVEMRTIAKVSVRLGPFLILCYIMLSRAILSGAMASASFPASSSI